MRAVTWHGKRDVRVGEVPDPTIQEPTDAVVRLTSTATCGPAAAAPSAVPVSIRSYPDGPLLVRGSFVLEDVEQGEIPVTRSVIALCRCGRSKAAPMCDGSHRARRSTRSGPERASPESQLR
jgi:CDGSH-type Zn-finger protein